MKKLLAYAFLTLTTLVILTIVVAGFWLMIKAALHGVSGAQFILELIGVAIGSALFAMAFFWSIETIDE